MSTSAMSQSVGKAPCGCGCSGGASSAPCTCGQASCTTCPSPAYIRPEFFAGQLLTEDDLQSLVNYVAAKNRLQARYLFGSGVVCGLKVKQEPCKCGKVIVEPGYALDCCGNDIVISCPQPLDINQMINALMIKLRNGYDCGDPCAKQEAADASSSTGASSNPGMLPAATNSSLTGRPKRYCLYVNYCEQGTDPVTPYATSTPCGQSVCQTTRVQEGFSFELRCPTKDCDCQPALCESLSCCLGDGTTADQMVAQAATLKQIAQPMVWAAEQIARGRTPEYDPIVVGETVAELTRLEGGGDFDVARLRELMVVARKAASNVARFLTVRKHRVHAKEGIDPLEEAVGILGRLKDRLPTHLERCYAQALVEVIQILVEHKRLLETDALDDADLRDLPLEIRFLQWDAVVTRTLMRESIAAMHDVRAWLLDRMQQTGSPADRSVALDAKYTFAAGDEFNRRSIGMVACGVADVSTKCQQFIRDCRCNALLPPCSTCTDTGVLLACVTVQDCCVTEICNLDRKFVLTGPNLRYWFPEIQRLGCDIEKCCCPSCECEQPGLYKEGDFSQRGSCEDFFREMQATCKDTKSTWSNRTNAFLSVFRRALAGIGELHAEHDTRISTDGGVASELEDLRDRVKALTSDVTKLKEKLSQKEKRSKEG
jgi:hypothetical protein